MDEENQLDDLLSIALNNAESSGQPAEKTGTETIHTGDTDSSDDEDNRDFENQKYNECGRSIKQLLEVVEPNSTIHPSSSPNSSDWKPKNVPPKKHKPPKSNAKPAVDSHPIFGLRVVNPLVSGSLLEDRMVGKENVTFARIKCFVRNTSSDKDWVVAGVIISKITKTSTKNGKPYTLWTLSDLRGDLKTIAVFLFGNAHKELWKTAAGTAVGILNAAVLDNNSKKDEVRKCSVLLPSFSLRYIINYFKAVFINKLCLKIINFSKK